MAGRKGRSFVEQRRDVIMDILREQGRAGVSELSERLGISSLTVRRDLDELEGRGLLIRHYGEAVLSEGAMTLAQLDELSPTDSAKDRIARAAAELVRDNEVVFVNTSTTALLAASHLAASGLTIVTNNLRAQELEVPEEGTILITGGEVRPPRCELSGEFALANIRNTAASTCLMGCTGIGPAAGVTSATQHESAIDSLMARRSDRMIIVADSGKLGLGTGFTYANLSQVNLLITDTGATDEDVEALLEAGIRSIRRV